MKLCGKSDLAIYCNDPGFLAGVPDDTRGPELLLASIAAAEPDDADLCFAVGEKVFFGRGNRNSLLSTERTGLLSHSPYECSVDDVAGIRDIINHHAHFTAHLKTTSLSSITKFISVELNRLDKNNKPISPNVLGTGNDKEPIRTFNRLLKTEILISTPSPF